jgi:FkbM family methyltransferase
MKIKVSNALCQPYYVYRPTQIVRRLRYQFKSSRLEDRVVLKLPWNCTLQCRAASEVGHSVETTGIYDLVLSEMIWRLTQRGDTALDIGANVGYVTSLMSVRVGSLGTVYAFEPHPVTFLQLKANVECWRREGSCNIELFDAALSDRNGRGVLTEPPGFSINQGLAKMTTVTEMTGRTLKTHSVPLCRHDDLIPRPTSIGLVKIDVEGHEAPVLDGARDLLKARCIRDIVFEEFVPYPATTHEILEREGYEIFHVEPFLVGPKLRRTDSRWRPPVGRPPNYIATLRSHEVGEKFKSRGWRCLRGDRE